MRRALALLTLVALGCSGGVPESAPPEADAAEQIRARGDAWLAAARAEDAAALAEIYAADAMFLPPGQAALSGRDTIRALYQAQFDAMDADYDFTIEHVEAAGDRGWRRGAYRVVARTASGDTLRADDKFIEVWRRDADGRWRIVADIWNANPPPGGAR